MKMVDENGRFLDEQLRLKLAELSPKAFEDFFLYFLNAGVRLTVNRGGRGVTRRVITAETYASASGMNQKGIDLRLEVEGGDVFAFQCKRHKRWNRSQTKKAIEAASGYHAHHYFLAVATNPSAEVHDEIEKHPDWTLWNLDRICQEFRMGVAPDQQAQILSRFLDPSEARRFAPFATEVLISPEAFFRPFLGDDKPFRQDWELVGRRRELKQLAAFLDADGGDALVVTGYGGSGKSRLLWEFTRDLADRRPGTLPLFLNPHVAPHAAGEYDFPFFGDAKPFLVVIDDAHRTEKIPRELLAVVAQNEAAKVIFATRPQGRPAVTEMLTSTGLRLFDKAIELKPLKRSEVDALAKESLGPEREHLAAGLVTVASKNPFLVAVAGSLVRAGALRWGAWADSDTFRHEVLRAFESENLKHVAADERAIAEGLLRLIALTAPVERDETFIRGAADCLDVGVFRVESVLGKLILPLGLVSEQGGQLRVLPDLFADFLVYEACRKVPSFTERVCTQFPHSHPAMLRNIAETVWLHRSAGEPPPPVVSSLLDSYRRQVRESSFDRRIDLLNHWKSFAVFLPAETIDLSRLAMNQDTAPPPGDRVSETRIAYGLPVASHQDLRDQLPSLLEPVATYHEEQRSDALDLLWEIGVKTPPASIWNRERHPWAAVARVFKYTPEKPVEVVLSALDWLGSKLKEPGALEVLDGRSNLLHTVLKECFARVADYSRSEGRTIHFGRFHVHFENTQAARTRALEILRSVIEDGDWRAALETVAVLEEAVSRVAGLHVAVSEKKQDALCRLWRPERRAALQTILLALSRHPHHIVRFEVRRLLNRLLCMEEDEVFAEECESVRDQIPVDLDLELSMAALSDARLEYRRQRPRPPYSEVRDVAEAGWNRFLARTADDLRREAADPEVLHRRLAEHAKDLRSVDRSPDYWELFVHLGRAAPDLALGLARTAVSSSGCTEIARWLPALVHDNETVSRSERVELFSQAVGAVTPEARSAVIRYLSRQIDTDEGLDEGEQRLLVAAVPAARSDDVFFLIMLIEKAPENLHGFAVGLLEALPLDQTPDQAGRVLQAIASLASRGRPPSRETVARVLAKLVKAKLDEDAADQLTSVGEHYPLEVYSWLVERIALASNEPVSSRFSPIPTRFQGRFSLPAMSGTKEFGGVCDDLWNKVVSENENNRHHWVQLWQVVVLADEGRWRRRIVEELDRASRPAELRRLADLVSYNESRAIFDAPEVAARFLTKARELGGPKGETEIRSHLYHGTGPSARVSSSASLSKSHWVETAAIESIERHRGDPILEPFFTWIVEEERKRSAGARVRYEEAMASLG